MISWCCWASRSSAWGRASSSTSTSTSRTIPSSKSIADGYYTNHDPHGDYYYGADISVHPDFRGLGIGRLLYDAQGSRAPPQ
ncbi:MAG: GNAT family N-acetyltransferase [Caldilineaceae bacterium]